MGCGFGVEFVFCVVYVAIGGVAGYAHNAGGVFNGFALGDEKHGLFFAWGE